MGSSDETQTFFALLQTEEDLDEELAACVEDTDIGPCIRHPLVYSMLHTDGLNAFVNRQLAYKRAALAQAELDGDFYTAVFLHERPYRAPALYNYAPELEPDAFWQLVAQVWTDSENIRQMPELWDDLLHDPRPARHEMMNADERAALANLPEVFNIFQGHTDDRDDGWSWSTSSDTAVWFAQRFATLEHASAMLSLGTARRCDVTAYLLGRGEREILIDPKLVSDITTISLDRPHRSKNPGSGN